MTTHERSTASSAVEDLESGGMDPIILKAIQQLYPDNLNTGLDPVLAKAPQENAAVGTPLGLEGPTVASAELHLPGHKAYHHQTDAHCTEAPAVKGAMKHVTITDDDSCLCITGTSIPGAYAVAPLGVGSTPDSDPYQMPLSTSQGAAESSLVTANAVMPPHQLPQADPFVIPQVRPATSASKQYPRLLWVFPLLAVGVAVLVVVTLVCKSRDAPQQTPTDSPTSSLEDKLLQILSQGTLNTAQSSALQWILEDPHLPSYIEEDWRVRQRFSLATLYYYTGGDKWTQNDHWLDYNVHECQWYARPNFNFPQPYGKFPEFEPKLVCDPDSNVYQHLWLYNNNLMGKLPEEIFWLTQLKSVSLFANLLSGTISSSIGELRQLVGWSVNNNPLTGSLPSEIGQLSSTLTFLDSFMCQLNGTIPTEIGKLSLVQTWTIDGNHLTGTIPTQVAGLSQLIVWYGNHNHLSGALPTEFGLLQSLVDVHLDINRLTGTLPSELGSLSALKDIGLVGNAIRGNLPTELGLLTTNLEVVELQGNDLTGTLPSELAVLPQLTHLLLQDNELTGTIPVELLALWTSHGNASTLLKSFNVTGNRMSIGENQPMCWTHSTYYDSHECAVHYPTALSCWCECTCRE